MPEPLKVQLAKMPVKARLVRGLSVLRPESPSLRKSEGAASGTDLDRLMEAAHRSGYEDAEREWTARLGQVLQGLKQETDRLEESRTEMLESFGPSVVDLAVSVAEKFLIGERERRAYSIKAIVESVMARMETQRGPLTVNLNPVDLESLGEYGASLGDGSGTVRLVEDPEVPQAGCRVDTGLGHVAFNLQEQLKEIHRFLMEMEIARDDESVVEDESPQAVS